MRYGKFRYSLGILFVSSIAFVFSFGCGANENQNRFPSPQGRSQDASTNQDSSKTDGRTSGAGASGKAGKVPSSSPSNTQEVNEQISITLDELIKDSTPGDVMDYLRILASEDMEGRAPGTQGGDRAARYIASLFHSFGLSSPRGYSPDYYQNFSVGNEKTQNIVGILEGDDSSDIVVLGAHYDHLGTFGSNVYYGADDNASGVSVLLYLAKQLAQLRDGLRKTVVLVAFSGEEAGLKGSEYYVSNPVFPIKNTSLMMNFDMVGYYKRGGLSFIKKGNFTRLQLDITNTCKDFFLRCYEKNNGEESSDHISFYNASVPSVLVHTGTHLYQHTFEDTVDKIDSEGILKIANASMKLIWDMVGNGVPVMNSSKPNNSFPNSFSSN